jgi:hypothetical protein
MWQHDKAIAIQQGGTTEFQPLLVLPLANAIDIVNNHYYYYMIITVNFKYLHLHQVSLQQQMLVSTALV